MPRERANDLTRSEQYWQKDSQGNMVPPQLQSDYLDWLLDSDRFPAREQDWCDLNGVAQGTVKKWKADRRFKEMWERRATERAISPERLQQVIEVLFTSATATGDVAAAKQYLLYAEKLMPPKEIRRDNSVAHLTDDELVAEMRALLADGLS